MTSSELLPLVRVYDLRDPDAWQAAHRHRHYWGKLYTDIHALGTAHVAPVFRSAGPRWLAWEEVRRAWIIWLQTMIGRRRRWPG
jgi:hypothetical protein